MSCRGFVIEAGCIYVTDGSSIITSLNFRAWLFPEMSIQMVENADYKKKGLVNDGGLQAHSFSWSPVLFCRYLLLLPQSLED
jgi:hypothetical protein